MLTTLPSWAGLALLLLTSSSTTSQVLGSHLRGVHSKWAPSMRTGNTPRWSPEPDQQLCSQAEGPWVTRAGPGRARSGSAWSVREAEGQGAQFRGAIHIHLCANSYHATCAKAALTTIHTPRSCPQKNSIRNSHTLA